MDTEEDIKIQKTIASGRSQTDEGPYYHGSWWESYKGSVKGELGGVFIGALLGAGAGLIAATVLSFVVVGGVSFLAMTAGFAAAGMLYAAHEFNEIGKVTGAVASAHEKSEERMKSFENSKFTEIKKEISELKSMLTGKPVVSQTVQNEAEATEHSEHYQTQHIDEDTKSKGFKPIFWKIAAIGLAVGMAAGALLAFGGISDHVIHAMGFAAEPLSEASTYVASMTVMGLFGASYGVNRDIFRSIFDRTDHLFKGIFTISKGPLKAAEIDQELVKNTEKSETPITTVVYAGYTEYPQSDTHHRDKVLTQAKNALLSLDHTKVIPN